MNLAQQIRHEWLTLTASNWPDGLCTALQPQYVTTLIIFSSAIKTIKYTPSNTSTYNKNHAQF